MAGFDVEAAELFSARAMVAEVGADCRTELARLSAAAHDLLGPGWRGAAAGAFGRGWHEWAAGAEQVLAALIETGDALGRTAADYEQHEATVTLDLQRIAS